MSFDFYRYYLEERGIGIPDTIWKEFSKNIERKEYRKKDFILHEGEVENYLAFVENGVARLFSTRNEKDITIKIVFENSYLTAYDSFLKRRPSKYSIQALTDLTIWRSSYENLQKIYEIPLGNVIARKSTEALYLEKSERELSLLLDTAEERYISLFEKNRNLIKKVPLKYIAEYIGITPQALSRIRKRIF